MIGTGPSGDVDVNLDELVGSHLAIVANSGGGKSGLIRKLLETTHGRIQHIVLDPEDQFYTLRERFDYVIAGGGNGDVPANLDNAGELARLALQHGFSLIVQLNDLKGGDGPEFVRRFLDTIMDAPEQLWHPALVVVDEVQRFADPKFPTAASPAIADLAGRGRKRGFTAVLAGLRITQIEASIRGNINNWMLGRVGQTLDRNTMADQLGMTQKEGREKLGAIDRRQFYALGPALARDATLFRIDDTETTMVRSGQAKVPTPPAPEALRAMLTDMVSASAEAAAIQSEAAAAGAYEAGTAAAQALLARDRKIGELETELAATRAWAEDEYARGMAAIGAMSRSIALLQGSLDEISGVGPGNAAGSGRSDLPAAPHSDLAADGGEGAAASSWGKPKAAADPPRPNGRELGPIAGGMPRMTRKLIDKLAEFYPRSLPIEHIARMAGVGIKSSQWRDHFRAFQESGLVEQLRTTGQWQISTNGVAVLGLRPRPNAGAELLAFWRNAFTPAVGNMLAVLVEQRAWMMPTAIAEWAGVSPTSSTLGSGLRELRDHGLAERRQDGAYRATEVLL